ncbi:MAG: conjugal transfer pilus assembly protein TraK [Betaproteobacteria bacterium HGW-Betaproteobacteria-6]|nr:MAG: conjugal transfer pilus assembly protein TraK [Betaproteobacteria bacterium HGW-Betaproteobacteria-6]
MSATNTCQALSRPVPVSRREWTMSTVQVIACIAAMTALPAQALQLVEASDGAAVEAILSIREPTRIRIEGASITDVFGNIHSSQCGLAATLPASPGMTPAGTGSSPINPAGEIALTCDRDKGEIYVRPVGDSAKPINLFVASANATYTLLLRRSDTPADTIVIRDRTPKALKHATSAPAGPSPNQVRSMKALLVAMASDRVPPDIRVEEARGTLPLWNEAQFSRVRQYQGRGLVGEKYLLQNISDAPMVLAEQEFDRERDSVVGIAIEVHNLRPGESTSVYVIRRGEMP